MMRNGFSRKSLHRSSTDDLIFDYSMLRNRVYLTPNRSIYDRSAGSVLTIRFKLYTQFALVCFIGWYQAEHINSEKFDFDLTSKL